MTIIAIMSANDGAGKTISAINLGYALANYDNRVLLIDVDPKGTMSRTLGISHNIGIPELICSRLNETSLYTENDYIVHHSNNLDCIASSNRISTIELLLAADENLVKGKGALNSLPGSYDFIIFDCQSGLSRLNCNILEVADSLVLPTLATIESVHYLMSFINVIKKLCMKRTSPRLNIDGIIMNRLSNNYDSENIDYILRQIKIISEKKISIYDAIPFEKKDMLKSDWQKCLSERRAITPAYVDLAAFFEPPVC